MGWRTKSTLALGERHRGWCKHGGSGGRREMGCVSHSVLTLFQEAGSEPASGETRLGNISGLPLPRARTLRESGKMEQEGRFVSRTHLHSPLRCWGGRAGPRKMGTDGQVVGGCHPSPKSTATVTLSSRLAHLTDLRGRGPAAGSPPSVPRSPHLRTPSSQ